MARAQFVVLCADFPKEVCFIKECTNKIKSHIQEEMNAAFKYMFLGAHFAQDFIERPGLAKILLDSASEERSHAILMMDYLNKRGIEFSGNYQFDPEVALKTLKFPETISYRSAIREALNMEIMVTDMIYDVVKVCADDFHAADIFTNPILEEQHDGMRKLQAMLKSFDNMMAFHRGNSSQEAMVEFMFDNEILSGKM